jgi:succinate dehydrogenase/fumarate reductase flavoprotein subunit
MTPRDTNTLEQQTPSFRVSRRNFLQAAGVGAAGAALAGAVPFNASRAAAQGSWDQEADIVVVGSGAAAFSAAATAHSLGNSVIVLEKANVVGGTTGKSGGVYWIPNNSLMADFGLEDPKDAAIRYMARLAFPNLYNADDPHFGLPEHKYDLIEGFYDNGPTAVDTLAEIGALQSTLWMETEDEPGPDYYAEFEENEAPRGRALSPLREDGTAGAGSEIIAQFQAYADNNDIPILLEHRVVSVVTNDSGEVIGVEATGVPGGPSGATPDPAVFATPTDGAVVTVRARKAVVFGSGGYTHNTELVNNFLRGPIFGGCAVPTNEGDFISIARDLDADYGNMKNAFLAEIVVEQALNFASTPSDVFFIPGDSMFVVNKTGNRVYNEKKVYNERTQVHWTWDIQTLTWPNLVLFMIYDSHTAQTKGGIYPIPAESVEAPYVITGQTWEELTANIDERLSSLAGLLPPHTQLSETFAETLADTAARFNELAGSGQDDDFHRGETPIEIAIDRRAPGFDESLANPAMRPLAEEGPYYAILLGPGTLDTNGGPKVNTRSQVLDREDNPIPGLYGAGNCIETAAGQAYWAAGGTIGPALTTGYVAGVNASEEPEKSE